MCCPRLGPRAERFSANGLDFAVRERTARSACKSRTGRAGSRHSIPAWPKRQRLQARIPAASPPPVPRRGVPRQFATEAVLTLMVSPHSVLAPRALGAYDHMVMAATVQAPGDAAVVLITEPRGLAATCDVTPRSCQAIPSRAASTRWPKPGAISPPLRAPLALTTQEFRQSRRPSHGPFVAAFSMPSMPGAAFRSIGNVSSTTNNVRASRRRGIWVLALIPDLSRHGTTRCVPADDNSLFVSRHPDIDLNIITGIFAGSSASLSRMWNGETVTCPALTAEGFEHVA